MSEKPKKAARLAVCEGCGRDVYTTRDRGILCVRCFMPGDKYTHQYPEAKGRRAIRPHGGDPKTEAED